MTATPNEFEPSASNIDVEGLLKLLRRKEGTWFDWGQACQQLQKGGLSPQQIFEASGFEPIQQNQLVVAVQVYETMQAQGISEGVRSRFERTGSDTLYEFRILSQPDRAAAAELVVEKGIDSEGSREVAKALKDFARLAEPPAQFPQHPGDAVAYHYWRLARQQGELQARSRLIAQGLRFAVSDSARKEVEKLLVDFTVAQEKQAPMMPVYRLETETDVPRVLPVVGKFPLTPDDLKTVPLLEEEGRFRMVRFSGEGAWVPLPGWQVVFAAEDPVVLIADSDQLPTPLPGVTEEVLVMVDRADREWSDRSYYVVDQNGQLEIQWLPQPPSVLPLGKVVLILRPKKVLDEDFNKELWQWDE